MRLYNYLNEEFSEDIVNELQYSCAQYISDLKHQGISLPKLLYSGRRGSDKIIRNDVRKNRKPLDTPKDIHNFIDKIFNKKFGMKPRSNSLFCYNDDLKTQAYGKPYAIFPTGRYKILWSPDVTDLYDRISNDYRFYIQYVRNGSLRQTWLSMEQHEIDKFDDYEDFVDYMENQVQSDFKEFIENLVSSYETIDASDLRKPSAANELMLMTDSYIGVALGYNLDVLIDRLME